MLIWLAEYLQGHVANFFHVFTYVTFRVILSAITSLALALWLGPKTIRALQRWSFGQVVRDDGPKSHYCKANTPTMGGLFILASILISTLLWADLGNRYIWAVVCITTLYAAVGFADDFLKISKKNTKGLAPRWKYFWLSAGALTVMFCLYHSATLPAETALVLPFVKNVFPQLGLMYIVLGYFVLVGSSNAVNLTDGLDGLAIVPTIMVAGALAVFAYVTGHVNFAAYLHIPYIPLAAELTIVCAAIFGAGLGFLWFNTHPALVFMGDVGSLALGGILGIIAILVRQELVFFLMSGVFVIEAVSVILQVGSYKLRGKRVFKMAPIHHHYEESGWPEPRVIVRFWIITVVLVLIGLATLKLR